jgi:hypothetical protein
MPIDEDSVGIFVACFDDFGGFWVTAVVMVVGQVLEDRDRGRLRALAIQI